MVKILACDVSTNFFSLISMIVWLLFHLANNKYNQFWDFTKTYEKRQQGMKWRGKLQPCYELINSSKPLLSQRITHHVRLTTLAGRQFSLSFHFSLHISTIISNIIDYYGVTSCFKLVSIVWRRSQSITFVSNK